MSSLVIIDCFLVLGFGIYYGKRFANWAFGASEQLLEEKLEDDEWVIPYNEKNLEKYPREIQDCLECSISGSYIKEPIITKYGHSFEKSMIIECININGKCPMTKQILSIEDLRPNKNLMNALLYLSLNNK